MNVTRVEDGNRAWIEPPMDQSWDDLTKLRWKAAVVTQEAGVWVSVEPMGVESYGLIVRSTEASDRWTSSSHSFYDAWTYLNGVSTGAKAAKGAAA